MSTIDASLTTGASGAGLADDVTAQLPIMVHSCNRLGRVANPPSFSFADWFRSARRRLIRTVSAAGCGGRQAQERGRQGRPAIWLPPAS